jgi:hypothetical protein
MATDFATVGLAATGFATAGPPAAVLARVDFARAGFAAAFRAGARFFAASRVGARFLALALLAVVCFAAVTFLLREAIAGLSAASPDSKTVVRRAFRRG